MSIVTSIRRDPADVASLGLDELDVSDPRLYYDDVWQPYFERLRREDPVHYMPASKYGPYWAVTRYKYIVDVQVNHRVFSSSDDLGGVTIDDIPKGMERRSILRMDPPGHDEQRKDVSPAFCRANVAKMEGQIRERTAMVLARLPRGEAFDWVDRVSIELTSMMLATLFGFPIEERRKLIRWSEVVNTQIDGPDALVRSEEERFAELLEFSDRMDRLWEERAACPVAPDLISVMAHSRVTGAMSSRERLGTLILFLVGGQDTTRNSMSGGVWALAQHPDQMRVLRDDPALVASLVPEIIRWQSPIIHMRRTALADAVVGGKAIAKGDKVVMWYISGNRDEEAIEEPNRFIVDRKPGREHLSFGFGIHRCLGKGLAEMQLRILWEEILKQDLRIEVLDRPAYGYSNLLHSITHMPVRIAG